MRRKRPKLSKSLCIKSCHDFNGTVPKNVTFWFSKYDLIKSILKIRFNSIELYFHNFLPASFF